MERLPSRALPRLPRIWLATRTPVLTGADVSASGSAVAARAVGLAGTLASRIASASYGAGVLEFRLRSGLVLLLGDAGDVKLKVAVAERVLPLLPAGSTFLDVSTPGRPVSGTGAPPTAVQRSSSRG